MLVLLSAITAMAVLLVTQSTNADVACRNVCAVHSYPLLPIGPRASHACPCFVARFNGDRRPRTGENDDVISPILPAAGEVTAAFFNQTILADNTESLVGLFIQNTVLQAVPAQLPRNLLQLELSNNTHLRGDPLEGVWNLTSLNTLMVRQFNDAQFTVRIPSSSSLLADGHTITKVEFASTWSKNEMRMREEPGVRHGVLVGTFPTALLHQSALADLTIKGQPRMSGTLPPANRVNVPLLVNLHIEGTSLEGPLPSLGNLGGHTKSLRILQLPWNRLAGTIPTSFLNWTEPKRSLCILNLEGNTNLTDVNGVGAALQNSRSGNRYTLRANTPLSVSDKEGVCCPADGQEILRGLSRYPDEYGFLKLNDMNPDGDGQCKPCVDGKCNNNGDGHNNNNNNNNNNNEGGNSHGDGEGGDGNNHGNGEGGDGNNHGNGEGGGGNSCTRGVDCCDNTIVDCCRQHAGRESDCRSKVGVCTWVEGVTPGTPDSCDAAGISASKCTGVTYSNAIFCSGQSEPGCAKDREVPGNPNQCEWKGTSCAPLPTQYCAALPEDCAALPERDCRFSFDVCSWADNSNKGSSPGSCVAK